MSAELLNIGQMLDELREEFPELTISKIRYLEGEVDHRDYILGDDEHGQFLTACVSRATSDVLVLDL